MTTTDVIIIGGGQAGLAMSRCLSDASIDHVILERGRTAERWQSERWDSLRLLTPNWQSRLPGWQHKGRDPHGYMSMPEVVRYLTEYSRSFSAPIRSHTNVLSVRRDDSGYCVVTDRGTYRAKAVVLATGQCAIPSVPSFAAQLPGGIRQVFPNRYKNPQQLEQGGVLVVGASATGLQLAEEIQASGRPVTLCVGRHTRLPRRYRGRDIMWWFDSMGVMDERWDEVPNLRSARHQPSLQLVGRPDGRTLDLGTLMDAGVRLVGRAEGISGNKMVLSPNLADSTNAAEDKVTRLLDRVDEYADAFGMAGMVDAPDRPKKLHLSSSVEQIDFAREGIKTVLWATGFKGHYPWLQVPVLDSRGRIVHDGGVTKSPGLYTLGLSFMRRRKSSYIDGVGDDARDLAEHMSTTLFQRQKLAA